MLVKRMLVNGEWKDVGQWKSDLEEIVCGKCPDKIKVHVEPLVKSKADALLEKYPSQEWLGYLIGDVDEDDEFYIRDMVIPVQEADSSSVEVKEYPEDVQNIIGVMHSHHNMGAFFSGVDDEFINANHAVSIVVTNKEWKITGRIKTPCGEAKRVEAEMDIVNPPVDGMDDFLKVADSNVKKKEWGGQAGFVGYGAGNYGGYHGGKKWDSDGENVKSSKLDSIPDEDLEECMRIGQVVLDTFTEEEIDVIKKLAGITGGEFDDDGVVKDVLDAEDAHKLGVQMKEFEKVMVFKGYKDDDDGFYFHDGELAVDIQINPSEGELSVGDIFKHPYTDDLLEVSKIVSTNGIMLRR